MGSNTQTSGLTPAAQSTQAELAEVVAGLRLSREVTHKIRHRGLLRELPSRFQSLPGGVRATLLAGLALAAYALRRTPRAG